MSEDGRINYLEFAVADLARSKAFFSAVFNWTFTDYGPEYTAFQNAGIEGGFYPSDKHVRSEEGAALIVFFSKDLERTRAAIEQAGGQICKPVFAFPGGRRFHFIEPGGNEMAVWSDQVAQEEA
ncbi:MAG: glyoxalase [Oleiphilus sp.]|nr:MAG: glyoxalase [Oleiphilus sp.]